MHPILNANLTHAAPSSPDQRVTEAQERSRRKLVSMGQYRTTCTFLELTVQLGKGQIVKPMSNDNGENEKVKNLTSFSREAA